MGSELGAELLIAAAGGYLFLRYTNWTRYKIHRETGYHLIFLTAATGTFLYAIAYIATFYIPNHFAVINDLIQLFPFDFRAVHLTFLLGVLLPSLFNVIGYVFRFTKKKAMRRAALQSGSHIEAIFAESFILGELVEITLKNKKSYVGLVYKQGIIDPQSGDSGVTLIPFRSGYRDKKTLKLELTADYCPMFETCQKFADLRIAVSMSEIVSARPFDLDMHEKLKGIM